jgi:flagellar basal-body rod protein FlgF
MVRGLYTLAAGMLTASEQLDITANNLANVDTAGFKRDLLRYISEPTMDLSRVERRNGESLMQPIGTLSTGTLDTSVHTDFSPGVLERTERKLDAAIAGDGFFVVSDGNREMYTRAGNFTISAAGQIVTPSGLIVQGTGGAIEVGGYADLAIGETGEVYGDGEVIAQLRLVNFADPQALEKVGGNAFAAGTGAAPDPVLFPRLIPGELEKSNAGVVDEMVRLIATMRHFEAAAKVVTATDDTLSLAASRVGTVNQ